VQDDDAMDRGISDAMRRGEPWYGGSRGPNGDYCEHDETGRFPDRPPGCSEKHRTEWDAHWLRKKWERLGVVEE
jgi:hypothetical protein